MSMETKLIALGLPVNEFETIYNNINILSLRVKRGILAASLAIQLRLLRKDKCD